MRRLRIFYDYEAFSDQSRGGISRYVLELATRVATEAEICLYAGVHRSHALRDISVPWVRGRYFPAWPRTGELRRWFNTLLTRRAIDRFRPDIVHRTYYRAAADYRGRHRDVVTLHDLTCFHFPGEFPSLRLMQNRIRQATARADRVICVSHQTSADAASLLAIPTRKLNVIHHGVTCVKKSSFPPDAANPYLLFVGQRAGYKNFVMVLEALAAEPSLAGLELLAFGDRPFSQSEQALIARFGLTSRVRWAAGNDGTLATAYRHATALVYPSLYEGFGLPPLEAMSGGCPVVCSNRGSLPEVVGKAAFIFDPAIAGELGRALKQIITSPETVAQLRSKGFTQAALFSWDRCAAETLALYRTLAD